MYLHSENVSDEIEKLPQLLGLIQPRQAEPANLIQTAGLHPIPRTLDSQNLNARLSGFLQLCLLSSDLTTRGQYHMKASSYL